MRAMRRNSTLSLAVALLATFAVAGCSNSAQNPAQSSFAQDSSQAPSSEQAAQPSSASSSTSSSRPRPFTRPAPRPAPPPQPVSISVAPGTQLHVVLDQALSSATAKTGQVFGATLVNAVSVDGRQVIPSDARLKGHVVQAKASGRLSGTAQLVLTLDSVEVGGRSYDIQTNSIARSGSAHKKRDIIAIGGGSAVGAIIGGIAGGGKGAAIGAAAGAGAGTAGAAATGKKDVELPAETALAFRLASPLTVRR